MGNPNNPISLDMGKSLSGDPQGIPDPADLDPTKEDVNKADNGGGSGEPKYLLLAAGAVETLSSFILKEPKEPRWGWDGPTFLAGRGLSEKGWQRTSDYGRSFLHGGVIGYYAFQLIDDHDRAQDRVLGLATAYLLTNGTTGWTKRLVGRARPDRSDNLSFFSGHTSSSAVLAVYLSADLIHTYGDEHPKWVGAIVTGNIASALLVGLGRVGGNKHYTSDVLTGFAVGSGFALLSAHFFINDGGDEATSPKAKIGLMGAGAGTLIGLGAEYIRGKFFSNSDKRLSLIPQGPAGSSGLTLNFGF